MALEVDAFKIKLHLQKLAVLPSDETGESYYLRIYVFYIAVTCCGNLYIVVTCSSDLYVVVTCSSNLYIEVTCRSDLYVVVTCSCNLYIEVKCMRQWTTLVYNKVCLV